MTITIRLQKSHEKEILNGAPWVMTHQVVESSEWQTAEAGSLATLETSRGEFVAICLLNPNSHIVCRVLTRRKEAIDGAFFARLFERALAKREALYKEPYYRLTHAEADDLPGLVVDRYGDIVVIQVTSAGMEKLQPFWLKALEDLVQPQGILLRNDVPSRKLEGLTQEVKIIKGEIPPLVEVHENGCIYLADLVNGQKTGWFYDMRDNRKKVAEYCKGKTMLDVFSHSGGFGLLAAKVGATVTMVDASELALKLGQQAAERNGVSVQAIKGDAVAVMQKLAGEGKIYDVVVADPPAYVKSKKDIASGMKGYAKVAEHAAKLVADGGILFTASCSHHASRGSFNNAVMEGIAKAGRRAEILAQTGASGDHPKHPHLPQNEYLKGLLMVIRDA